MSGGYPTSSGYCSTGHSIPSGTWSEGLANPLINICIFKVAITLWDSQRVAKTLWHPVINLSQDCQHPSAPYNIITRGLPIISETFSRELPCKRYWPARFKGDRKQAQTMPTLLVGGRDFSVVYNTWRGFFSLYNYNFNCIFWIVHYLIFNWKVMYQNVAKHYSARNERQTFVILTHVKKYTFRDWTLDFQFNCQCLNQYTMVIHVYNVCAYKLRAY